MVKIESITPGASASIIRNGNRQSVFSKQLVTYDEIQTLEVTGGDVVYSIDEQELVTKRGVPAPTLPPATTKPELPDSTKAAKVK